MLSTAKGGAEWRNRMKRLSTQRSCQSTPKSGSRKRSEVMVWCQKWSSTVSDEIFCRTFFSAARVRHVVFRASRVKRFRRQGRRSLPRRRAATARGPSAGPQRRSLAEACGRQHLGPGRRDGTVHGRRGAVVGQLQVHAVRGALGGHHALQHVEGRLVCLVGETRGQRALQRGDAASVRGHLAVRGCQGRRRGKRRNCRRHPRRPGPLLAGQPEWQPAPSAPQRQ